MRWVQLCHSLSILCHCLSLALRYSLTNCFFVAVVSIFSLLCFFSFFYSNLFLISYWCDQKKNALYNFSSLICWDLFCSLAYDVFIWMFHVQLKKNVYSPTLGYNVLQRYMKSSWSIVYCTSEGHWCTWGVEVPYSYLMGWAQVGPVSFKCVFSCPFTRALAPERVRHAASGAFGGSSGKSAVDRGLSSLWCSAWAGTHSYFFQSAQIQREVQDFFGPHSWSLPPFSAIPAQLWRQRALVTSLHVSGGKISCSGCCQRSGLLLMPCWVSTKHCALSAKPRLYPKARLLLLPQSCLYLSSLLQIQCQTLPWSEQDQSVCFSKARTCFEVIRRKSTAARTEFSSPCLRRKPAHALPVKKVQVSHCPSICPSSPSTTQWACLPCVRPQFVGLKNPSQGEVSSCLFSLFFWVSS